MTMRFVNEPENKREFSCWEFTWKDERGTNSVQIKTVYSWAKKQLIDSYARHIQNREVMVVDVDKPEISQKNKELGRETLSQLKKVLNE